MPDADVMNCDVERNLSLKVTGDGSITQDSAGGV